MGAAVAAVGGPEAAVLCIEASVYDYLELLQQHSQLCADMGLEIEARAGAAAALHLCAQVLHAVSRGSELHAFLAARLLESASSSSGPQGGGAAVCEDPWALAAALQEALVARYGADALSEGLIARTVERSREHIL